MSEFNGTARSLIDKIRGLLNEHESDWHLHIGNLDNGNIILGDNEISVATVGKHVHDWFDGADFECRICHKMAETTAEWETWWDLNSRGITAYDIGQITTDEAYTGLYERWLELGRE